MAENFLFFIQGESSYAEERQTKTVSVYLFACMCVSPHLSAFSLLTCFCPLLCLDLLYSFENLAYKLLVGLSFHFPFTLLNSRLSLVGTECGVHCKIQASLFFSLCMSVCTPTTFFRVGMPKSKVAVITTSGKRKVCLFLSLLSFRICVYTHIPSKSE